MYVFKNLDKIKIDSNFTVELLSILPSDEKDQYTDDVDFENLILLNECLICITGQKTVSKLKNSKIEPREIYDILGKINRNHFDRYKNDKDDIIKILQQQDEYFV